VCAMPASPTARACATSRSARSTQLLPLSPARATLAPTSWHSRRASAAGR
jgi:hypothetical protein